ncbi:MAG: hypothetical protein L0229_21580 [Blastocatellia bacterium]|nr:hypothetical protein [Blastocatellia bacterium]
MKVAILSESPADEAAIRILVDGILGRQTELINLPMLRTRNWVSVFQILPAVLYHLHYETDAEALVVVVDSDNTAVHTPSHDQPDGAEEECRLCRLRGKVFQFQKRFTPAAGRAQIKTAIGLAVPAIEAWFRCGVDPQITEAALIQKMGAPIREVKNRLKLDVYGIKRASLELKTRRGTEEAERLAQNIDELESLFPNGFGSLARDVRKW